MNTQLFTVAAVGAVVVLVLLGVSLVVFVRRRKARTPQADQEIRRSTSPTPDDSCAEKTALPETVVRESPSEDLLSPVTPVDWRPPAEPAPAAHLPAISLAERTRRFDRLIPEVASVTTPPVPEGPPTSVGGAMESDQAAVRTLLSDAVAAEMVPSPDLESRAPAARPDHSAESAMPLWQPPHTPPKSISTPSGSLADETAVLSPCAERPRANARPLSDAPVPASPATLVWPDEPASPPVRAEFVDMVAPVEMWFGDYRVGVKSGSTTHAQFRKYADALLGDLKGENKRTR